MRKTKHLDPLAKWGIDEKVGIKLLKTIDAGLTGGMGKPIPGKMCIEAAVCYALGEPHSDEPSCVDTELRDLKIDLNDLEFWKNKTSRARGLRRLGIVQLGTEGQLNRAKFLRGLAVIATSRRFGSSFYGKAYYFCEDLGLHLVNEVEPSHREAFLTFVCEDIVQLLIKLRAPGAKLLYLTEPD